MHSVAGGSPYDGREGVGDVNSFLVLCITSCLLFLLLSILKKTSIPLKTSRVMQNIKDKIEITHSNIKSNTRNDEDLPMQTSSENLMETNHRVETSKNIPTQTSSEKFGANQPCITSRNVPTQTSRASPQM